MKLRAAGLTRRKAELRMALDWSRQKKAEIATMKVEYEDLLEIARSR